MGCARGGNTIGVSKTSNQNNDEQKASFVSTFRTILNAGFAIFWHVCFVIKS